MKDEAEKRFIDMSLRDFARELSSKSPVPGGGGAAAYVGALSVALSMMVGSLTVGKKRYTAVEKELRSAMKDGEELLRKLLEAVDEDARAFKSLSEVYRMPRNTHSYDDIKEKCLTDAAAVPLKIMRLEALSIDLCCVFADKGNRLVLSDAASAAAIAISSMKAAYVNVKANTSLMKNRFAADELENEAGKLLEISCAKAELIYEGFLSGTDAAGGAESFAMKGAPLSNKIAEDLSARAAKLLKEGISPTLSIVRLGGKESDLCYERSIFKKAESIGVRVHERLLPEDAGPDTVKEAIEDLSADESIHGVLLLRPLSDPAAEEAAKAALTPRKDVDAMTTLSVDAVFGGGEGFLPCTAEAVIELLKHYHIKLSGRRALVIGRSDVIGKPIALLLLRENATVTVAHSKTKDLGKLCPDADIIVAAAGKEGLIEKNFLRKGQVLVDVGTHIDASGHTKGDIPEELKKKYASCYTPIPGGVGVLTTMILLRHVTEAAEKAAAERRAGDRQGETG